MKYQYVSMIIFLFLIFATSILNIKDKISDFSELSIEARMENGETLEDVLKTEIGEVESIKNMNVNLNGAFQRLLGKHYIYDVNRSIDLIKTEDGYLVTVPYYGEYQTQEQQAADALIQTSETLKKMGIDLLYVQCPGVDGLNQQELLDGFYPTSFDRVEFFLNALKDGSVNYLDCRTIIDTNSRDSFFKTDHHWTMETALDVSKVICESLVSQEYVLEESTYGVENYTITVHEEAFLGAEGRRVGRYYAGLDDISVITPDYETDFTVRIPSKEIIKEGSFENSIMDNSKDISNYSFTDSAYYMYWGGDYPLVEVTNNLAENDYNIMIVKDSYGIPVSAFMANSFKKMSIVDMRYYQEQTLYDLVEEEKPDAVIFVYGTGYLGVPAMFSMQDGGC